jgi:predicted RNA-binding protein (virulence factor B family)
MLHIGKMNRLRVVKVVDFGVYLDSGDGVEVLLPSRYAPTNCEIYDTVLVFIYHDNSGRLVATTKIPKAMVGQFRLMQVKTVVEAGAFLEWGLMKDLLVPHREQKTPMLKGQWYMVYVYLDLISKRIVASSHIDRFLDNVPPRYMYNQEVNLVVDERTDLGYKVIVNNLHWGLVYSNEVFRSLRRGEVIKGYIRAVREDDKIDVSLAPLGYGHKVDELAERMLALLEENDGYLAVHDNSPPGVIYNLFGSSKKNFKLAVGLLYRRRQIILESEGIRLKRESGE